MSDALTRLRRYAGSQAQLARALGLSAEHVSRISTGKKKIPAYMEAVAELLEALPPKDWPERWEKPQNKAK